LILRKIIKLVVKQILHFKIVIHQYNFGWGSLTALPQFLSRNLGISLLRERKEGKVEKKWEKKEDVGRKRKQENRKGT